MVKTQLKRWIEAVGARRELWLLLGLAILLLALAWFRDPLAALMAWGKDSVAWVQSFGIFAPVAYIVLYVLQIVVAPLPGNLVTFMGGYLFGTFWGTVYSLVGIALGALVAASLARWLGRPAIQRLVGAQELSRWEQKLRLRAPLTWVIILILPVPDAMYYAAGLTQIPLRWLLVAVLIGRAPALIVNSWLGAQALTLPTGLFLTLLALVVVVLGVAWRYQRPLRLAAFVGLRRGRDAIRRNLARV